ncbi:hypothetical protein BpHYR1_047096 [Brachionus plicatilis]|uniref:Uncharacterized protein n=1 Tax=Brachionus plicatilis TaxID=10195 RepID=A0A3M7Q8U0_BRAPC|nr:hypothetical protein BpHYR1_047096 [Brachionus plicatilis]
MTHYDILKNSMRFILLHLYSNEVNSKIGTRIEDLCIDDPLEPEPKPNNREDNKKEDTLDIVQMLEW